MSFSRSTRLFIRIGTGTVARRYLSTTTSYTSTSTSTLSRPSAAAAPSIATPPPSVYTATPEIFEENCRRFFDNKSLTITSISDNFHGCEVFANNDTPLAHVHMYGFDYDYTLATYNDHVGDLIYREACRYLIDQMGYPANIATRTFDRNFAIRGLHYDHVTGFFLKIDQFGKIQSDTVHHGREPVSLQRILKTYNGLSVSREYMEKNMRMMTDLFVLPEACLLADISEIFLHANVEYTPKYLFQDVRTAIDYIHHSGLLHNSIVSNPERYLDPAPHLGDYLGRLRAAGKRLFLLTNSPFKFVDAGMRYLLHDYLIKINLNPEEWTQCFDVTIFSARKPSFYTRDGHFRSIDLSTGSLSLSPVTSFKRGGAYTDGGLKEFTRLAGVTGSNVLYMGDHVSADLVIPSETVMWKTCAVIKEIAYETKQMSTHEFQQHLHTSLQLETLIDYGQRLNDKNSLTRLEQLKHKRSTTRHKLKTMFNPRFGSVFRTTSHRTHFFFEVARYADIYTSSLDNLFSYPLDYCFYAKRPFFPHERQPSISFPTPTPTTTPHQQR